MAPNGYGTQIYSPTTSGTGSAYVWQVWTGTPSTTTLTSTTLDPIWGYWNSSTIASPSATYTLTANQLTTATWPHWIELQSQRQAIGTQRRNPYDRRAVSDEQRAKWAAEGVAYAKTQADRIAAEALAKEKAFIILNEHLTPEQAEDLETKNYFFLDVHNSKSGKVSKYRIDRGTHGNVKLLDETGKKVVGKYCVQPNGVPVGDAMLAQKLWLETDEDAFKKVANFTRYA